MQILVNLYQTYVTLNGCFIDKWDYIFLKVNELTLNKGYKYFYERILQEIEIKFNTRIKAF